MVFVFTLRTIPQSIICFVGLFYLESYGTLSVRVDCIEIDVCTYVTINTNLKIAQNVLYMYRDPDRISFVVPGFRSYRDGDMNGSIFCCGNSLIRYV